MGGSQENYGVKTNGRANGEVGRDLMNGLGKWVVGGDNLQAQQEEVSRDEKGR